MIAGYGRIDAAVLTVGGFAMGGIADTSTAEIAKQYTLNFETAYNVARPVLYTDDEAGEQAIIFL